MKVYDLNLTLLLDLHLAEEGFLGCVWAEENYCELETQRNQAILQTL